MRPRSSPAIPPLSARRGFTLLELLVAITILAVVAVISWRGISTLTTTRERLEPLNDEVRAMLAGFGQMERDLAQAPANVALFALPTQPVRVVLQDGHAGLMITRLAPSPDGSPASAVQTVFYRVANGALVRRNSPAQRFSGRGAGVLEEVVLVPQIDDMQIRVWRTKIGWITPASDADTAGAVGVEVRLRRPDGSFVRRVLPVG